MVTSICAHGYCRCVECGEGEMAVEQTIFAVLCSCVFQVVFHKVLIDRRYASIVYSQVFLYMMVA